MESRSGGYTTLQTTYDTLAGPFVSSASEENIISLPNQCLNSDREQNNVSHRTQSPSASCEQNSISPNDQLTPSPDEQNPSSLQCVYSACEQNTFSHDDQFSPSQDEQNTPSVTVLCPASGCEPSTIPLNDQCTPCGSQSFQNFTDCTDECWYFANDSCYICNNSCGPSKGQVCSACHSFLYPPDGLPSFYFGSHWPTLPFNRARTGRPTDQRNNPNSRDSEREDSIVYLDADGSEIENPFLTLNCGDSREDPTESNVLKRQNSSHSSLGETKSDYSIAALLPPEMLLEIFSKLDDRSLWNAGDVCLGWRQVSRSSLTDHLWRSHTKSRWPLFKTDQPIHSWCSVYSWLLESCPCKSCLFLMDEPVIENRGNWETFVIRRRRLMKENRMVKKDPREGVNALALDETLRRWTATIAGPVGSPFEGGTFHLSLQMPENYPFEPPTVRFMTKIFHPNVSRHGDIGVDSILFEWNASQTIGSMLIAIQSLLTDPFCQVCMEPEVGKMYIDDRQRYEAVALNWTRKYAIYHPDFADTP